MIVYLRHHEIDREQWDNCINDSPGGKPYGFSWYLDIMAPGWEALVEDDYDSVFPVPGFKKFGIKYVATPVFLQQLGAYSPDTPPRKAINEFLEYLPEFYWLIDLCTAQRTDNERFRVTPKTNYELDLSGSYDKLWDKFSSHCKRNIEKAGKKKTEITEDIKPAMLIELFRQNAGERIKGIKERDYQRLNELIDFCIRNKKGRILAVPASKKRILYGLFLVEIKARKTMLFVVNTEESRKKRLGYHIVNELIRESAGTRAILDFAGSSIPSIAAFMESFGSRNVPFYRNYRNMLPWPVRWFK